MDFGDTESERSSPYVFNVMHTRGESGSSQDAQYRPRKSPRKRLRVARTSASLVIDQLKNVFLCPGDLVSRVRTGRNWRPEFLTKYFRDGRRGWAKECDAMSRHDKRNFVPEAPKICSIGLRSGGRDDFSNSCDAIGNFKKRLNIARRPTIVCKYWVTQSTAMPSLSADVALKADRRMTIDCTSTGIISKCNRAQKSNRSSRHSQLHEHIEERGSGISDTLRNDHAADHRSGDFKDPSVREDHRSCRMTRDAQIQTSSRMSSRRRRTRRRPTTKGTSQRRDNEARMVADSRAARSSRRDEPWLRVLESKRIEYVNKFTAVNRQIEEITATLRETCCDDGNSRSSLENCDEYFSSISDEARVNARSDVESGPAAARGGSTSREEGGLVNVKRTIGGSMSDRCEEVQEVSHVGYETVASPEKTIASSRNPETPNDVFGHDSVRATKEAACSSNRIPRDETRARCRFAKPTSLDQERSIGNDRVRPRHNFAVSSHDEHARDLAESLANLEELRYRRIVEKMIGEVAVLEDIKRRIDRDFDGPPAEGSENDAEDFLTVSERSGGLDRRNVVDVESKSVPLIVSTEAEVHNASEHSNENSAPSKYFSCTRIPSLVSLTRSESETVDQGATDASNLHSSYDYGSHASPNDCSFSNLDSSFDRLQIREGEPARLGTSDGRERRTADSTLETSKSSRYVGSIDSGVFSSSLIDVHPAESPRDVGRTRLKKKHRAGRLDGPPAAVDSGSDSSCTDDTLERKVNDVVRDLTKNLILCERKARLKLKARDACYPRHACKFSRSLRDTCRDFFDSPGQSSEDERIVSISTPSLLSLSDSEIEDREARRQRVLLLTRL